MYYAFPHCASLHCAVSWFFGAALYLDAHCTALSMSEPRCKKTKLTKRKVRASDFCGNHDSESAFVGSQKLLQKSAHWCSGEHSVQLWTHWCSCAHWCSSEQFFSVMLQFCTFAWNTIETLLHQLSFALAQRFIEISNCSRTPMSRLFWHCAPAFIELHCTRVPRCNVFKY